MLFGFMSEQNVIELRTVRLAKEQSEVRSLETVEEVAWDLMNAALAMSIAMSKGDQIDGRDRIVEWLNGDGVLEEHLSGTWSDLSILNGDLEIKIRRQPK